MHSYLIQARLYKSALSFSHKEIFLIFRVLHVTLIILSTILLLHKNFRALRKMLSKVCRIIKIYVDLLVELCCFISKPYCYSKLLCNLVQLSNLTRMKR
jgi:hypothetical protein